VKDAAPRPGHDVNGTSCANGYRFAKRQGKPNFAIRGQSASNKRFCDFTVICAENAFTRRSSRYLNCSSILTGHDHPNKPANGELNNGMFYNWTGAALGQGGNNQQ